MHPSQVIQGPVVTEKSERNKATLRTYVLRVHPKATKVEVKNALKLHYDIEVQSVRSLHIPAKSRTLGGAGTMEKRHASKRMVVTLTPKSKALDLTAFQES